MSCVVFLGAGYPTMRPNNLKHSTNLQKLKLVNLNSNMSILLIYIMCSCIYFLMFILIPVFPLTYYIYSLFGLDISNFGLEKTLKHWPNLVELK